jgi:hypothetical protein
MGMRALIAAAGVALLFVRANAELPVSVAEVQTENVGMTVGMSKGDGPAVRDANCQTCSRIRGATPG